jgi:hypothetical protein
MEFRESESTNGTIHEQSDDGEEEVTSRCRSLSDSVIFVKKKFKKELLWEHLARLVVEKNTSQLYPSFY